MSQATATTSESFMAHAQAMLRTHSGKPVFDREVILECIKACYDCAQTCVACADACVGERDPHKMMACIRLNADCADVCETTGKIISRQTALDVQLIRTVIQCCQTVCRTCAEECEKHASSVEHCKVCAEACRTCEKACQRMLSH